MMNWKKTYSSNCEVRSVVWFLTIENNSGPKIHHRLCTAYREENVMNLTPGLHSHWTHSSRLSARCEWDEVRTNVDIHTLVRELRDKVETFFFPLTQDWFTDIFLRASRWDKNRSRMWQTRRMYPSHSRSCFVLSRWDCKPGIRNVQRWQSMFRKGRTNIHDYTLFSKMMSSHYYWHVIRDGSTPQITNKLCL